MGKLNKNKEDKSKDEEEDDEEDGGVVFTDNASVSKRLSTNPLNDPTQGGGASTAELRQAHETIEQLQSEVKELKKKVQANALKGYGGSSSKKVKKGNKTKKKLFAESSTART